MKLITDEEINLFKKFLNTHDTFIVAGHKEPDGDCISSSIGITSILKKLNKPYQLVSAGPFKRPETKCYENLFAKKIVFPTTEKKIGLIIVDCGEIQRLGDIFPTDNISLTLSKLDIFIIDHHKTSNPETDFYIIDSETPAAACLVQQLYEKIIGKIEKEIAELLFFGISTDTGYFRFLGENSAEVFKAVARLIDYGVSPRIIYDKMNSGKPYSTRKLLGITLNHTERYFDGKLAITYENMEDTHKYGLEGRDSDSLYQLLLSSADVEAVVFIRQENDQNCTMGFRSKDKIDVSTVAAKFGGGGHKNASGCSTQGTIENLIPKIIEEFEKIF